MLVWVAIEGPVGGSDRPSCNVFLGECLLTYLTLTLGLCACACGALLRRGYGLWALALLVASSAPAAALSIELNDVAPDRVERQRKAAEGALPLPGTPDVAKFAERLEAQGLKAGMPILIRVFKQESELEVWIERDEAFVLFATYPICQWSGTLGPKISEGDKQTPEGFYTVTRRQLHRAGRWRKALNLGFPNAFDRSQSRTGSYILVHGGCSSVGCFAMTNAVIEEIFKLTTAALAAGQGHVPVHVFPFRMTDENLRAHADSPWRDFWIELREGYDSFERRRQPPQISICQGRYHIGDALDADPEAPTAASASRRSRSAISPKYAIQSRCPELPVVAASEGNDRLTDGEPAQRPAPPGKVRPKRGASTNVSANTPGEEEASSTVAGSWWMSPAVADAW